VKRRENELKAALVDCLRHELPTWVHLTHQDVRSSGRPDVTSTGRSRTTWLEVKHGTPDFDSQGIQELTMMRLARAGAARYIIYIEDADGSNKRTLIVHPRDFKTLEPQAFCKGFDHKFVADWLRSFHG